jgi:hypothetical protein
MSWVSAALAVVCLAVSGLHLARLALHAGGFGDVPGGPVGEVSHAAMALGMAAMFSPLGDPLPGSATPPTTSSAARRCCSCC